MSLPMNHQNLMMSKGSLTVFFIKIVYFFQTGKLYL